jgi:uncharacterized protein (TIGR04255 family)
LFECGACWRRAVTYTEESGNGKERMTMPDALLPDYAKPPIVEVVFAASFAGSPLSTFDIVRFGIECFGDEFPVRTEQPPVQMPLETFDRTSQLLAPSFALLTGAPPIRLWFQSEDRSRLVQIQRDWLACNWKRGEPEDQYPRYPSNRDFFIDTWRKLEEFVKEKGLPVPVASQCELSYINQIVPEGIWDNLGQVDRIVRSVTRAGEYLPEPEDIQTANRYRIKRDGKDIGRLYVAGTPVVNQGDPTEKFQLQLVARGAPLGEGEAGMLDFFDLAHEWIVNGFAAVTTEAAQNELWERKS